MQKKISVFLAIIGLVLTSAVFVSCPNPIENKPETVNYTVSFVVGDGSPAPVSQTVKSGESAVRPEIDPVNGDYHFGGWFTAAGVLYNFSLPVTTNLTLTAKWQCVITFYPGEGSFVEDEISPKIVYADLDIPFQAPAVSHTDEDGEWSLAGWTLDPTVETPELYYLEGGTTENISLTAVWTQSFVITFDTAGATSVTQYPNQVVEMDSQITEPTLNPVKNGYIFRFWSRNGTDEYDFDLSVTESFELTAIYGLDILSVSVLNSSRRITVNLKSGASRPEEGAITLTASVNGGVPIPIVVSLVDYDSYYKELEYSYSQIVPSSFDNALSIVVTASTNVVQKSASTFTIPQLQEVSGLTATASDMQVVLKWTYASGYASYRITYTDHLGGSQEISSLYSSSKTVQNLQNGFEYTFKIFATDNNATETAGVTISATPELVKKSSDWLFIQYMDGDNDLHDYIWVDINEMERGLYYKPAEVSAQVVVLWDGWTGDALQSPQYGSASTRIYELGSESIQDTYLSSNTKDLTHTAPWLASGEVDMSSRTTLESFLEWAREHYEADHVVLGFSNHGGGPRSATPILNYPDGRQTTIPSGRRAMCWDEASGGTTFLSTNDVSTALANSGYGPADKLGMILLDVCLGGSVEEAYEYRNYADYFVASPNNIPGTGLDYYDVIRQLKTTDTVATVGKRMVYDYREDYEMFYAEWDAVLAAYAEYGFTADNIDLYYAGATLSCVNLAGMDNLRTAIDNMASLLVGAGGDVAYTGLVDGEGAPVALNYRNAIKELLVRYTGAMNYMGSYTWLYDLGYVAGGINYYTAATINGQPNENAWADLNAAAAAVLTALQGAVDYAWRDGYRRSPVYNNSSSATPGIAYGLMISGETFSYIKIGEEVNIIDGIFPAFYTTDNLAFAASPWALLLDAWF